MESAVAHIGFGEAGMAFARPGARAYDRKTRDPATHDAKRRDYADAGVTGCVTAAEALAGAERILSLVTADQSLAAALAAAEHLAPGALWLDMNCVAPETKREAARAIEAAGGRHVDVAVMAPVLPARLGTPLLVSGPHADAGIAALAELGFTQVRSVGARTGAASAIKMIRSVMVKGIEALSAECALAADAAGVLDEVLASLDASDTAMPWAERVDYNLDRMMRHGARRAAEMAEVARTLGDLGISPVMSEGSARWQQGIGTRGIDPPEGLEAKLAALDARTKERRA
jgi:3-hydroxyisobutyrate dehydrogenase-like beta-hydroxyacid dehydrogenase